MALLNDSWTCPRLGRGILGWGHPDLADVEDGLLCPPSFPTLYSLFLSFFPSFYQVFIIRTTPYVCCWVRLSIVFSSAPFPYMFINQSVVLRPVTSESHVCLLGMQYLWPHPRPAKAGSAYREDPQIFSKHVKIERHHFIPISFQECKMDKVIPAQPTLLTALN